ALRRPTDPRPETERKRRSDRDKDKEKEKEKGDHGMAFFPALDATAIQADVERAIAEAQPDVERAVTEAMAVVEPGIDAAVAAALLLDRQQRVEQRARGQRRIADDRSVEKHRLRPGHADRHGVVIAGHRGVCEKRA